jgi:dynein intermediate chain 2, axonemal
MDVAPDDEEARRWRPLPRPSVAIQAGPSISEHAVNTDAVVTGHRGMCHTEGGWPREVNPTDAQAVSRWRKRVERDEDYIKAVAKLGGVVEQLVLQNNALDVYADVFASAASEPPPTGPPAACTVASLRSAAGTAAADAAVQTVCWHPDGSAKLSVAYALRTDLAAAIGTDGYFPPILLWDLSSPLSPASSLTPAAPVTALAHNPKDQSLLAAAQADGRIAVFDLRTAGAAAMLTSADSSHRGAARCVGWPQSKSGGELMSCGADGVAMWWDARSLDRGPIESLELCERAAAAGTPAFRPASLDCSAAAGPAKFLLGVQQGSVLAGNRRAAAPQDRIAGALAGHHGPVLAVARNPWLPRFFMSVGDWTLRAWAEDVKSHLLATPYREAYLTGGAWSATRPAVALTISGDGHFEAWDLLRSHCEPALAVRVCDGPLRALGVQPGAGGEMCAVGGDDGAVTILRLSEALTVQSGDERAAMAAVSACVGRKIRPYFLSSGLIFIP